MHCYQAFLCYWDGYHLKKCSEPYSAQMVLTDPSGSWTNAYSMKNSKIHGHYIYIDVYSLVLHVAAYTQSAPKHSQDSW